MYIPYNLYVKEIEMMEHSGSQLSLTVCLTTVTRHAEDYSPLFPRSEVELSTLPSRTYGGSSAAHTDKSHLHMGSPSLHRIYVDFQNLKLQELR